MVSSQSHRVINRLSQRIAIIPYPVDHYTWPGNLFRVDLDLAGHLKALGIGIKEWLGLLVYYFTGKTATLFPLSCR